MNVLNQQKAGSVLLANSVMGLNMNNVCFVQPAVGKTHNIQFRIT